MPPWLLPPNHMKLLPVMPRLRGTEKLHALLVKSGSISMHQSSLINGYCESGMACNAVNLFDEMPNCDIVSATAIMGIFTRLEQIKEAIHIFARLLTLSITPNEFTFSTVIHGCTRPGHFHALRQLHACAAKTGLRSNVFVGSSLVDALVKLGRIEDGEIAFYDIQEPNVVSYTALISGYLHGKRPSDALALFGRMREKSVVSWNAIISGLSQTGHNEEAVNLFVEMCREGIRPNGSTLPCVFAAAADIAALGRGRSFHAYATKLVELQDVFIANSIISFYAKCGCMEDSLSVFDKLLDKNVVSWNALIGGYAQNGRGREALQYFRKMCGMGVKPNSVTLLGVLFTCNHAGLIDEGCIVFNQMRSQEPCLLRPEHYACMVDMLSRSRRFLEAKIFVEELPFEPGIGFWKASIGGSHLQSNNELVKHVASKIHSLDPGDSSSFILLSNIYSAAGSWLNASMIRREMKKKGMTRIPGCSWIEIGDKINIFVNGDKKHHKINEIHGILSVWLMHIS